MKLFLFKMTYILLFAFTMARANPLVQNTYILSNNSTITIHGTSTISNWQDTVEKVTGSIVANMDINGNINIHEIHIKMEVNSIKSDKGSIMDSKTFKALKGNIYPEINFTLNIPVKLIQIKRDKNIPKVIGNLTLAGISRSVIMQITSFQLGQGKLQFDGSQNINMTDFGIKPPSALFGTIKSGNNITINFKSYFTIKQN